MSTLPVDVVGVINASPQVSQLLLHKLPVEVGHFRDVLLFGQLLHLLFLLLHVFFFELLAVVIANDLPLLHDNLDSLHS